ncbi:hypothetical protein ABZ069_37365 [Streptomyces microflavus]|uniref:hypothetical protein n=1 Tax=Streptomyces microflavus TaxID=1919 RepID=UPI0033A3ADA6
MTTPCPGCRTRPRGTGRYLCLACWSTLPAPTRRELRRRDRHAFARLRSLHTQLDQGVPLTEITVTTHG